LLKDLPLAKEFDFNGAIRVSEYNLAGEQKTWKLGVTDRALQIRRAIRREASENGTGRRATT